MKTGKTSLMVIGAVLLVLSSLAPAGQTKGDPNQSAGSGKAVVKPEPKESAEPDGWILTLASWLDLTKGQVALIQVIVEQAQPEAKVAAAVVAATQAALHEAVVNDASDARIRVAAGALGLALGDQAVLHAQTLASIKIVLTKEQLKRFEEIKTKLAQRMAHPKFPNADAKSSKSPTPDKTAKGKGDTGDKAPTGDKTSTGGKTSTGDKTPTGDKTSTEDTATALIDLFIAADANKDGMLTMDELNAYLKGTKGDQPAPKK